MCVGQNEWVILLLWFNISPRQSVIQSHTRSVPFHRKCPAKALSRGTSLRLHGHVNSAHAVISKNSNIKSAMQQAEEWKQENEVTDESITQIRFL